MAIPRTNTNLAQFCLEVLGAPYWFGTFGTKASRQLYNEKKAQYPSYYPPKSWTEGSFTDDFGKRVCDCAGLIKWFLWSDSMSNKNPTYKSSEDWGATTFYSKCTSKGKISTLPANKIGLLVFNGNDSTKSHVGVIVSNDGTVVEAKGHAYGVIKSKASSWGYWGKCNLIKYDTEPAPTPEPTGNTYKVVNIHTFLAIRTSPENLGEKNQIGKLFNGAVVTVKEIKGDWANISGNCWCSTKYLQKI